MNLGYLLDLRYNTVSDIPRIIREYGCNGLPIVKMYFHRDVNSIGIIGSKPWDYCVENMSGRKTHVIISVVIIRTSI